MRIKILGPCPRCGKEDVISGGVHEELVCHNLKCQAFWKYYNEDDLGEAFRQREVVPVGVYYSRSSRSSRSMLQTGVWLPEFLLPHPNKEFILESVSVAIASTFSLAIVRTKEAEMASMTGFWYGFDVQLRWKSDADVLSLVDCSGEGKGNWASREIMRWTRKLFAFWCTAKLEGHGCGKILKLPGLTADDKAALQEAVFAEMRKTKFRFRVGGMCPMDKPPKSKEDSLTTRS